MTQQQPGMRSKAYVRKLPRLTQEQIIAQARQQVIQETDPSYSGHSAGIHPEHQPYLTDDYELEEGDEYYETRLPTSARRYQEYDISPEHIYQSGNTRLHVRYVGIPKRSSRQKQLPPHQQPERYTEEVKALPKARQHKRSIHPFLCLGIGMVTMAAIFLLLSSATTWIQLWDTTTHQQIRAILSLLISTDTSR